MIQTRTQPRICGSDLNDTAQLFRGGQEEKDSIQEAAGQTFKRGDFLGLTGGLIAISHVDGSGNLDQPIAGLADSSATGVTGSPVLFPVLRADTQIEMNVYHATPASAELAKTMLGGVYGIIKVGGIWSVDLSITAEGASSALLKVKIVKFIDKVGDRYGRVVVKIVPFTIETDGGGIVRNLALA